MRGEKRAGSGVLLQMFYDGPGDGEAIERCGAAADFIEKNEAGRSGVGKDAGDFAHFNEEGGAAASEIVTSADAREDAVGEWEFGLARRNERTHLRHENDKRGLTKISRLASHVGAGDEEQLLAARFE